MNLRLKSPTQVHTKTFQKGWLSRVWAAPLVETLTFRLQSHSWLNLQWNLRGKLQWAEEVSANTDLGVKGHFCLAGQCSLECVCVCVCVDVCVWGSWQPLYGMIAGLAPEGREIWRQQVDSRREVFSANGERGFKSAGVEMTLSISTSIHPSSLPQMNWGMDP